MDEDIIIRNLVDKFTLTPEAEKARDIRELLIAEIENPKRRSSEVLKLYCIFLFSIGKVEDTLLIWKAKELDFDTASYIDIQLLCGAGYEKTVEYLGTLETGKSQDILKRLVYCKNNGDFDEFSVASQLQFYKEYFGS